MSLHLYHKKIQHVLLFIAISFYIPGNIYAAGGKPSAGGAPPTRLHSESQTFSSDNNLVAQTEMKSTYGIQHILKTTLLIANLHPSSNPSRSMRSFSPQSSQRSAANNPQAKSQKMGKKHRAKHSSASQKRNDSETTPSDEESFNSSNTLSSTFHSLPLMQQLREAGWSWNDRLAYGKAILHIRPHTPDSITSELSSQSVDLSVVLPPIQIVHWFAEAIYGLREDNEESFDNALYELSAIQNESRHSPDKLEDGIHSIYSNGSAELSEIVQEWLLALNDSRSKKYGSKKYGRDYLSILEKFIAEHERLQNHATPFLLLQCVGYALESSTPELFEDIRTQGVMNLHPYFSMLTKPSAKAVFYSRQKRATLMSKLKELEIPEFKS